VTRVPANALVAADTDAAEFERPVRLASVAGTAEATALSDRALASVERTGH